MDAIIERCAGLDVHQRTVVACILYGPLDRKPKQLVRTFGTTTRELLSLLDWLTEYEVTHVAMESSGVYWKPVWNILEGDFTLILANAQRIKNVPGRKTDVNDAVWIAQLLRCGLIESSMVPPKDIRRLRDYTRYRRKLLSAATSEKNRIHKVLQDANIKLTTFMSDVFGVSGRALLQALVKGKVLQPHQVQSMVHTHLKKKVPALVEALNGRVDQHHRKMIQYHLNHLDFVEKQIAEIIIWLDKDIAPLQADDIELRLKNDERVFKYDRITKEQAFAELNEALDDPSLLEGYTPEFLSESFRIRLKDNNQLSEFADEMEALKHAERE